MAEDNSGKWQPIKIPRRESVGDGAPLSSDRHHTPPPAGVARSARVGSDGEIPRGRGRGLRGRGRGMRGRGRGLAASSLSASSPDIKSRTPSEPPEVKELPPMEPSGDMAKFPPRRRPPPVRRATSEMSDIDPMTNTNEDHAVFHTAKSRTQSSVVKEQLRSPPPSDPAPAIPGSRPKPLKRATANVDLENRQRRINELLDFEREFMEMLSAGLSELIEPLRTADDISRNDIDAVIGNIESIYSELKSSLESSLDHMNHVGDMLVVLVDLLPPYILYIANQSRTSGILSRIREKNGFAQALRRSMVAFGLDDLLQSPAQHIADYAPMIQRFTAAAREEEAESEVRALEKAEFGLRSTLEILGVREKLPRHLKPIWDIRHSFTDNPPDFEFDHTLSIQREGLLKVLSLSGLPAHQDVSELQMFVFNQFLLCAKYMNAYSLSTVMLIPRSELLVQDVSDEEAAHAFDISHEKGQCSVRVGCSNLYEKQAWLHELPVCYPERQKMRIALVL